MAAVVPDTSDNKLGIMISFVLSASKIFFFFFLHEFDLRSSGEGNQYEGAGLTKRDGGVVENNMEEAVQPTVHLSLSMKDVAKVC